MHQDDQLCTGGWETEQRSSTVIQVWPHRSTRECTGWMSQTHPIKTYTQMREDLSRREIDAAVASGQVERAGRYFVAPGTDDAVVAALRRGARSTCLTAARYHGIWTPPGPGRHVYTRRGKASSSSWITHGYHHGWPEGDLVASPALLLEHATRCIEPLHVGILAESALHQGVLHEADVAAIRRASPRRVQRVLDHANRLAESGTESKVRLHLELHQVPVQAQVEIDGVGRVDLLIGDSWILECDSKAHHQDEEAYETDRGRDFRAAALGYKSNRLTYDMCFSGWDETVLWLAQQVATGDHLITPARRLRARRVRR